MNPHKQSCDCYICVAKRAQAFWAIIHFNWTKPQIGAMLGYINGLETE